MDIVTPAKSWQIERRYTEFREFKNKMEKHLESKGLQSKIDFPRKFLFSNLNSKRIEERMKGLEEYLSKLSEIINFIDIPEACLFLEIDSYTKTLLSSLEFDLLDSQKNNTEIKGELKGNDLTGVRRAEEIKITEFLHKINTDPNNVAKAVDEFETFYFGQGLQLKKKEIKKLLWGDTILKGLLQFCGDNNNYIASNSCIQFFTKLIKFEYNSVAAEKFMKIFGQTSPLIIKQMNLSHHIKQVKSLDGDGLLALFYYLKYNTHDISEPQELIPDSESINEYERWLQNKVTCGNNLMLNK